MNGFARLGSRFSDLHPSNHQVHGGEDKHTWPFVAYLSETCVSMRTIPQEAYLQVRQEETDRSGEIMSERTLSVGSSHNLARIQQRAGRHFGRSDGGPVEEALTKKTSR